tara:strand:- start:103 stop:573 length:471 start_codon:yes stop_codon:yes gene_type:complete
MDFNSIKSTAFNMIADKRFIMIICLATIFIIAAIYVWKTYISSRINSSYVANKEYIKQTDNVSKIADLYFFYTEWCPHCNKARPEWNKFKESVGDNKVKGVLVNFIEIDCDKDTETADRFKVDGYPTIKLVHNDRIIEYDAKPDINTLRQFLNVSL